jgi:lipopolysaccharide biosynthesis protein
MKEEQGQSVSKVGVFGENFERELARDTSKIIAFYLPQFHRIRENDEWWGPGFTEWTNVATATPNFEGHSQPRVPRELGFYDLTNPKTLSQQVQLASAYGIHGFSFYYYWFSGRRLLEKPLDTFVESSIDFPFCVTWANENWTRTWDGMESDVLVGQKYESDFERAFLLDLKPLFEDSRYIRVGGKPLLIIYRVKAIPNVKRVVLRLKELAVEMGFAGLHVVAVDFYDIAHPDEVGADALVEFPPHKFNSQHNLVDSSPNLLRADFEGHIFDYKKIMRQGLAREKPEFKLYRGAMPGWDNTARRQLTSTIVTGSSPELFKQWLIALRKWTRDNRAPNEEDRFIFVNAWNEWGEGAYLEPDLRTGLGFLESVLQSSWIQRELNPDEGSGTGRKSPVWALDHRVENPGTTTHNPKRIKSRLLFLRDKVAIWLTRFPRLYKFAFHILQAMRALR